MLEEVDDWSLKVVELAIWYLLARYGLEQSPVAGALLVRIAQEIDLRVPLKGDGDFECGNSS